MNDALHGSRASTPATGSLHPAIEFIGVDKRFPARGKNPEVIAARNVTLSIQPGEVVSLIGPSGCGKSTLLNMGSGLAKASAGTVKVNGEVVTGPNKHVAFMLQKDLLMPWRTISQNVEFGLELRGVRAADRAAISEKLLAQCHLKGFGNSYPHQLSGGMRQRAAMARTLAVDPIVLLMDEPFSALDAQTKMILQQDLARTVAEHKKTVLFITHDLAEAVALSDRILVMSERPGTIVEEIVVEIPGRDNPMARRKHPAVGDYVSRLMDLLKLDAQTDVH
ncbi:MAG: ABC transporter ATP-binding protein [Hydrogenophaga sp.]|uniref:ABC transporter ATP-binding protein n=1 Tax=Hydrogenophaga sp. TaxID=1904254 RepID=UPI0026342EDB|nr:ABC transporter ATP-binding protein [Hydrogenophaga sp.]MCW5672090.1 ABC transporter ATP-binding protein [Hydrogenophaga sp.]